MNRGRKALFETGWENPGERGEFLDVVQYPTFLFQRMAGYAKTAAARRYVEPFGLSMPHWRLLTLIVDRSPLSFAEITARSLMDKGQVSRTLRVLERMGLVQLGSVSDHPVRTSGVNPRVVVSITPAGRGLYEQIVPVAQQYQVGLINLLTQEERKVFLDVLERMMKFFAEDTSKP
ncbi:MAG: MarR family transcriptional regulator [Nevskiaceae bacterium]|nr:MarR family transcriptional regulator [Nevskiaceae bacterium]